MAKKLLVVCYYFVVLSIIFLSSWVKDNILIRSSDLRKHARWLFGQKKFYEQMHEIAKVKGLVPTEIKSIHHTAITA